MAASVAVMNRRRKMRAMRSSPAEYFEEQMVVKSLSVPPGLETLMEGLTKEVLKVQPRDICMFASDYFAKLIKLRENAGDHQYCKTTINQKTKQQRLAVKQSHHPKNEVEFINAGKLLSVPRLYLGRLKNERETKSINNSEIKNSRSEASTAEIDKLQNGFFEGANLVDKTGVSAQDFDILTAEKDKESQLNGSKIEEIIGEENQIDNENVGEIKIISDTNGEIEETELTVQKNNETAAEIENDKQDDNVTILTNEDSNDVTIIDNEDTDDNIAVSPADDSTKIDGKDETTDKLNEAEPTNTIDFSEDNEARLDDSTVQESEVHKIKKRSISNENISKLEVPEISTTVATPLPSDEETEIIQDTITEDDEAERKKAATKIQSIWRGFKIRNNKELNLHTNEDNPSITEKPSSDLINAATVIQSLWRGYSIRKTNKAEVHLENTVEVEDEIAKENAELIEMEKEIQEVENINLEADIDDGENDKEKLMQEEKQYLADEFEDIDELDKLKAEEVDKVEDIEVEQSTDNEENVGIKEENSDIQRVEAEEISENIKEENVTVEDIISTEKALENEEDLNVEEAVNPETALENEETVAVEDALNIVKELEHEEAAAVEDTINIEKDLENEEDAAVEYAVNIEKALENEEAAAVEDATNIEKALETEGDAAVEDAVNIEKALENEEAAAVDTAINIEKALENEETAAVEDAVNIEKELENEDLVVEDAVNIEKALETEGDAAVEDAVNIENTLENEEDLAVEDTVNMEKALENTVEDAVNIEKALENEETADVENAVNIEKAFENEEVDAVEEAANKESELEIEAVTAVKDVINLETALEIKEASQELAETTDAGINADSVVLNDDGTEKPVTFILGAEDEDLDENGDIKDHFQQKIIAEDIVEDVTKTAEDQINIGIEKAKSTGQILELTHDDIVLSPIKNIIDSVDSISDDNEEVLNLSADITETEESNAIDSLEYKTELEIADEISDDLEKLKAWITDEKSDQLIVNDAMKEKSLLTLNTSEVELEHLNKSSPHLEETHDLLEINDESNEEVDEQTKLKAAEEIIMKALGLQHSGEMHDSLGLPTTNDELNIEEVVELQHSGEMHDSIDIPLHTDNHEIEENYIVEEAEDEIKENLARLKKQIGVDISEVTDDEEESAEHKENVVNLHERTENLDYSVNEALETVINTTNDAEQSAINTATEVNDFIEEKAIELDDTITNVTDITEDTIENGKIHLEELKEEINDDIEENAEKITNSITNVEADLTNELQDTIESIGNETEKIEEIKENIEDGIQVKATELEETITDETDNIANTFQETKESAEAAGNQLEELKGQKEAVTEEKTAELTENINPLIDNASHALQELNDTVENAEDSLEDLEKVKINLESEVIKEIENTENNAQNVIDDVNQEINEVSSEVTEKAEDLREDVTSIEENIYVNVSAENIEESQKEISDTMHENIEAFTSELENTENQIQDAVHENLSGISTNVENVENKIEDEIENIEDKLNENLIGETGVDKNDLNGENLIAAAENLQTDIDEEDDVITEIDIKENEELHMFENEVKDVEDKNADNKTEETVTEASDNLDIAEEKEINIEEAVNENEELNAQEDVKEVVEEVEENIEKAAEEVQNIIEAVAAEGKDNTEDAAAKIENNVEEAAKEVEDNLINDEVKEQAQNIDEILEQDLKDLAQVEVGNIDEAKVELDTLENEDNIHESETVVDKHEEILEIKEENADEDTKEQNESIIADLAENIENFDKYLTENLNLDSEINYINDPDNNTDSKTESNEDVVSNKLNEDDAATKIQAAWRGFNVRRTQDDKENLLLSKPAECDELPHQRGEIDEEEGQDHIHKAATTIQSGVRGYLVRKRRHLLPEDVDSVVEENALAKEEIEQEILKEEDKIKEAEIVNQEAQIEVDKGMEEIINDTTENIIEPTVVEEEIKIDDASNNTVDEIAVSETGNMDNIITDVPIETASENQEDLPQEIVEVKDSLDSDDVVIGAEDNIPEKETSDTIIEHDETQKVIDDAELLNQRLQNLTKTNVYEQNESQEDNLEVPDSENTARSSDSLNSEADNKEVEQILKNSSLTSSPNAVNLDDFDSSRYDLKSDYLTPRAKNISPMEELLSSAYKLGARLSVNDDKIVDAIDPKGEMEEKAVEYIVIPLQGPMPVVEEPIKKEYVSPRAPKDDPMIAHENDEDSPEYIYIPLKDPASDNSEILDENIGLLHSGEMHDSLGFPHEENEETKVGDDFKNVDKSGLLHSGEMHDSLVLPEDNIQEFKDDGAEVISLQHSGEIHDMIDTNIELINDETSYKKSDINFMDMLNTVGNENSDFEEKNEALENNLVLREENVLSLNEDNSISEEPTIQELHVDINTNNNNDIQEASVKIEEVEDNIASDTNSIMEDTTNSGDYALSQHANLIERNDSHATEQNFIDIKNGEEISINQEDVHTPTTNEENIKTDDNIVTDEIQTNITNDEMPTKDENEETIIIHTDIEDIESEDNQTSELPEEIDTGETVVIEETTEPVTVVNDKNDEICENEISKDNHDTNLNVMQEKIIPIEETGENTENEILSEIESQIEVDESKADISNLEVENANEIDVSNTDEKIISIDIKEQDDEDTNKNEETLANETNEEEGLVETAINNNDNDQVCNETDDKSEAKYFGEINLEEADKINTDDIEIDQVQNADKNQNNNTEENDNSENIKEISLVSINNEAENEDGAEKKIEIIAKNDMEKDTVIIKEENSNNDDNTEEIDVKEINIEHNEEINTNDVMENVSSEYLIKSDVIDDYDNDYSNLVTDQNDNNLQEIEEAGNVVNENIEHLTSPAIEEQAVVEEINQDESSPNQNNVIQTDNEEIEEIEKDELVIEEANNDENMILEKKETVTQEADNEELCPEEEKGNKLTEEELTKTEEIIHDDSTLKVNEENKEEQIIVEHVNSAESNINIENESEEKEQIMTEEIINKQNCNNDSEEKETVNIAEALENNEIDKASDETSIVEREENKLENENDVDTKIDPKIDEITNDISDIKDDKEIVLTEINETKIHHSLEGLTESQNEDKNENDTNILSGEFEEKEIIENTNQNTTYIVDINEETQQLLVKENDKTSEETHEMKSENLEEISKNESTQEILIVKNESNEEVENVNETHDVDELAVKENIENTEQSPEKIEIADGKQESDIISKEDTQIVIQSENNVNDNEIENNESIVIDSPIDELRSEQDTEQQNLDSVNIENEDDDNKDNIEAVKDNEIDVTNAIKEDSEGKQIDDIETVSANEKNLNETTIDAKDENTSMEIDELDITENTEAYTEETITTNTNEEIQTEPIKETEQQEVIILDNIEENTDDKIETHNTEIVDSRDDVNETDDDFADANISNKIVIEENITTVREGDNIHDNKDVNIFNEEETVISNIPEQNVDDANEIETRENENILAHLQSPKSVNTMPEEETIAHNEQEFLQHSTKNINENTIEPDVKKELEEECDETNTNIQVDDAIFTNNKENSNIEDTEEIEDKFVEENTQECNVTPPNNTETDVLTVDSSYINIQDDNEPTNVHENIVTNLQTEQTVPLEDENKENDDHANNSTVLEDNNREQNNADEITAASNHDEINENNDQGTRELQTNSLLDIENLAATTIQKTYRGYRTRRDVNKQTNVMNEENNIPITTNEEIEIQNINNDNVDNNIHNENIVVNLYADVSNINLIEKSNDSEKETNVENENEEVFDNVDDMTEEVQSENNPISKEETEIKDHLLDTDENILTTDIVISKDDNEENVYNKANIETCINNDDTSNINESKADSVIEVSTNNEENIDEHDTPSTNTHYSNSNENNDTKEEITDDTSDMTVIEIKEDIDTNESTHAANEDTSEAHKEEIDNDIDLEVLKDTHTDQQKDIHEETIDVINSEVKNKDDVTKNDEKQEEVEVISTEQEQVIDNEDNKLELSNTEKENNVKYNEELDVDNIDEQNSASMNKDQLELDKNEIEINDGENKPPTEELNVDSIIEDSKDTNNSDNDLKEKTEEETNADNIKNETINEVPETDSKTEKDGTDTAESHIQKEIITKINASPITPRNSPIDDIDAFLERRKSSPRSVSRSSNIDNPSTRQLFNEIDSLIESYGQKRRMSPTENGKFDLESPKIDSFETPKFERNLSIESINSERQISPGLGEIESIKESDEIFDHEQDEYKENQEHNTNTNNVSPEPEDETQNDVNMNETYDQHENLTEEAEKHEDGSSIKNENVSENMETGKQIANEDEAFDEKPETIQDETIDESTAGETIDNDNQNEEEGGSADNIHKTNEQQENVTDNSILKEHVTNEKTQPDETQVEEQTNEEREPLNEGTKDDIIKSGNVLETEKHTTNENETNICISEEKEQISTTEQEPTEDQVNLDKEPVKDDPGDETTEEETQIDETKLEEAIICIPEEKEETSTIEQEPTEDQVNLNKEQVKDDQEDHAIKEETQSDETKSKEAIICISEMKEQTSTIEQEPTEDQVKIDKEQVKDNPEDQTTEEETQIDETKSEEGIICIPEEKEETSTIEQEPTEDQVKIDKEQVKDDPEDQTTEEETQIDETKSEQAIICIPEEKEETSTIEQEPTEDQVNLDKEPVKDGQADHALKEETQSDETKSEESIICITEEKEQTSTIDQEPTEDQVKIDKEQVKDDPEKQTTREETQIDETKSEQAIICIPEEKEETSTIEQEPTEDQVNLDKEPVKDDQADHAIKEETQSDETKSEESIICIPEEKEETSTIEKEPTEDQVKIDKEKVKDDPEEQTTQEETQIDETKSEQAIICIPEEKEQTSTIEQEPTEDQVNLDKEPVKDDQADHAIKEETQSDETKSEESIICIPEEKEETSTIEQEPTEDQVKIDKEQVKDDPEDQTTEEETQSDETKSEEAIICIPEEKEQTSTIEQEPTEDQVKIDKEQVKDDPEDQTTEEETQSDETKSEEAIICIPEEKEQTSTIEQEPTEDQVKIDKELVKDDPEDQTTEEETQSDETKSEEAIICIPEEKEQTSTIEQEPTEDQVNLDKDPVKNDQADHAIKEETQSNETKSEEAIICIPEEKEQTSTIEQEPTEDQVKIEKEKVKDDPEEQTTEEETQIDETKSEEAIICNPEEKEEASTIEQEPTEDQVNLDKEPVKDDQADHAIKEETQSDETKSEESIICIPEEKEETSTIEQEPTEDQVKIDKEKVKDDPEEQTTQEETQIDETKSEQAIICIPEEKEQTSTIEQEPTEDQVNLDKEPVKDDQADHSIKKETQSDETKSEEAIICIPEEKEQTSTIEQEPTEDQLKMDKEQNEEKESEEETINNSKVEENQDDVVEHAGTHDESSKEEITSIEKEDGNIHELDELNENVFKHAVTEEYDTANADEQILEKQTDLLIHQAIPNETDNVASETDKTNINNLETEINENVDNEETDKNDNNNIQEQCDQLEPVGIEDNSNKEEIEGDEKKVEEPELHTTHEENTEIVNQAIDVGTHNTKEDLIGHTETEDESSKIEQISNEENSEKTEECNVNEKHSEKDSDENNELIDKIDNEEKPQIHAEEEQNPEIVKQTTDNDMQDEDTISTEIADVSSNHEDEHNVSNEREQKDQEHVDNKVNEETLEHTKDDSIDEEHNSKTPENKQEENEDIKEQTKIDHASTISGHLTDENPGIQEDVNHKGANQQDIENIAATTIQNAYRGYRAKRDTTLQTLKPQERKNSSETNKTYTIEAISSPDDISSDEEIIKNAAAAKIQSSFRNYKTKRSLSLNDAPNVQTENGQVQDLKINELEDKLLASPVRDDKHHDAQTEELKDFSEITHSDVLGQNLNRNYKTRHSLDNSALNVNLDTIPEDAGDVKLDLSSVSPQQNDEEETARIEDDTKDDAVATMSPNSIKLETIPESISPALCQLNKEEHLSNAQEKNVVNIENESKTNTPSDETFYHNNSENISSDSSMENSHSHGSIDKSTDMDHHNHDDFELDSGFARDYITDGEDAEVETSGIQSEDSIYDGDESDAKTSPDDNLEQGRRRRKMDAGDYEERRVAPLEESSDINNDTLDIFLSSEELSQGAEMLTSREDLLNTSNDGHEEAKKSEEESVCCGAQSRNQRGISAPTPIPAPDDIRAHMETTANSQTTTVKCTQQKFTASPTPGVTSNMGEGKEETSEQLAATKIQAGFRGYQVRKQMKTKKPSSDNNKDSKRCNSGRRRNSGRAKDGQKSSDLEERSATKIQAGIRGFLVRKRQNKTKDQQA